MNISWLGTAWAAVKGFFSFGSTAKLAIVDYILDCAYDWYANVDRIVSNVSKAYNGLITICDKLDYYRKYIPEPWIACYDAICGSFYALRDTLADGKIERPEIERIVQNIKSAISSWNR